MPTPSSLGRGYRRAAPAGRAPPAAGATGMGSRRDHRILEDLPSRGLCDLALPLPDVTVNERRAGVHLPVSLLDLCARRGWKAAVRTRRPVTAAAPADDRCAGLPPRRRPLPRGHRAVVVERSPLRVMRIVDRILHRRFVRGWVSRAAARSGQRYPGSAPLRVSRSLVLPARGDRALFVPGVGRNRDLPDAVLHPRRRAGDLPRALRPAARRADVGGLPFGPQPQLQRAGWPAVPPGAPLGRRRVHRRDRAAPDARSSSPAPTASRGTSTTTSGC